MSSKNSWLCLLIIHHPKLDLLWTKGYNEKDEAYQELYSIMTAASEKRGRLFYDIDMIRLNGESKTPVNYEALTIPASMLEDCVVAIAEG